MKPKKSPSLIALLLCFIALDCIQNTNFDCCLLLTEEQTNRNILVK